MTMNRAMRVVLPMLMRTSQRRRARKNRRRNGAEPGYRALIASRRIVPGVTDRGDVAVEDADAGPSQRLGKISLASRVRRVGAARSAQRKAIHSR
jgi:hypothetical protein